MIEKEIRDAWRRGARYADFKRHPRFMVSVSRPLRDYRPPSDDRPPVYHRPPYVEFTLEKWTHHAGPAEYFPPDFYEIRIVGRHSEGGEPLVVDVIRLPA